MHSSIARFVAFFQFVLLLAHLFVYESWIFFWGVADPSKLLALRVCLSLLCFSFVAASLLAFRYYTRPIRWFYTLAAAWLGAFSYLFFAAVACWLVYGVFWITRVNGDKRYIAAAMFGGAFAVSAYGLVNAAATRVRRITVKLPNLPEAWRGRVAALVSDLHLGHVRNLSFVRGIVSLLRRHRPDVVFIAGDLYDGTAVNENRVAAPLSVIEAPLGTYFVAGNHEEFRDHTKYLEAVGRAGVRVLNNENVDVEGLQIVGVHYRDATHAEHFRGVLRRAGVDRERASVLLTHAPDRLPVAEEEGISLQLSGHTHRGQYFPFTWITKRIYGPYVYGLQRLGRMLVYTSCGVGTWGPPMRVGSSPEIVLITFE